MTKSRISRRAVLAGTGAAMASPCVWTSAKAQASGPIKIGIPAALTGPLGNVGQQTKRAAELFAKLNNEKGGILGRKVEVLIEDPPAIPPPACARPRRWSSGTTSASSQG